tara:strand:+ start:44132 stop:44281 length:150 start_codon:yes stop_codon:yes gene_type:complete
VLTALGNSDRGSFSDDLEKGVVRKASLSDYKTRQGICWIVLKNFDVDGK